MSCNLLGQKKSNNLSGHKKNHATSRNKKNHATSQDTKKITQPLGTKKLTQPLKTKKSRSQQVQLRQNQSISTNRLDQVKMDPNLSKLIQKGLNGSKQDIQVLVGTNRFKWVHRGPKQGSKIGVQNYHELNRMAFKPRSPGSCSGQHKLVSCLVNKQLICLIVLLIN